MLLCPCGRIIEVASSLGSVNSLAMVLGHAYSAGNVFPPVESALNPPKKELVIPLLFVPPLQS